MDHINSKNFELKIISNELLAENYDKAQELIVRALEKFPDDIELLFKLGFTCVKKGELLQAARRLVSLANHCLEKNEFQFFSAIEYYMEFLDLVLNNNDISAMPQYSSVSQEILNFYYCQVFSEIPDSILTALKYLECHGERAYPYVEIHNSYAFAQADFQLDPIRQCGYFIHNGKKLYYMASFDKQKSMHIYKCACMEQSETSPHRYLTDTFNVSAGDIVMDIGAAEANFTLDVIERCKKAYVFEPDPLWIEPLTYTFEPWAEKVTIINKFVSDAPNENTVTIDEVLNGETVNFMKIDIEGFELKCLQGAIQTLKNSTDIKIVICTYHRANDAEILKQFLEDLGFTIEFSDNYMLFLYDTLTPPYFRKGLIRATKKSL